MHTSTRKRWSARFVALAMVTGAFAAVPAASAQAGTPGFFTICNNSSSFGVDVQLPATGTQRAYYLPLIGYKQCTIQTLERNETRRAIIHVHANGRSKEVRNFTFSSNSGVDVKVRGTFTTPIVARS
ncbi:hypothetical protein [Streptomyces sp. NPDC020681]|uniref:hypothetical protein n=1 Tax=Streptomyces sp. NPDC020681 TaxID=3365083 RepID=UPI0037AC83F2